MSRSIKDTFAYLEKTYNILGLRERNSETMKESCEYMNGDECVCTSQDTCANCRFYHPSRLEMEYAVASHADYLHREVDKNKRHMREFAWEVANNARLGIIDRLNREWELKKKEA